MWNLNRPEVIDFNPEDGGQSCTFQEHTNCGHSHTLDILDQSNIVLIASYQNRRVIVPVEAMHKHFSGNSKVDAFFALPTFSLREENRLKAHPTKQYSARIDNLRTALHSAKPIAANNPPSGRGVG